MSETLVETVLLPAPCPVLLAGPGAPGRSTWAAAHLRSDAAAP